VMCTAFLGKIFFAAVLVTIEDIVADAAIDPALVPDMLAGGDSGMGSKGWSVGGEGGDGDECADNLGVKRELKL
jgi:hypothetical protein